MARILSNSLRVRNHTYAGRLLSLRRVRSVHKGAVVSPNTKLLAWTIFLIIFIENGTLGLLPRSMYYVYRSVRLSDLLIYGVIIYSLFCTKEYQELIRSRSWLLVKIILLYMSVHFITSVVIYDVNLIEYFFRLKLLWSTFMIFPYFLLLKRNGLNYLVKLIIPVSVVSNILYILTALTGTPYLPDVSVVKTTFVGGITVYRVFGGTFLGDLLFLGFLFYWVTNRFRLYQLFLVIIFLLPHVLALGRGTWMFFLTCIMFMLAFNIIKKKEFKAAIRQIVIVVLLFISFVFVITTIVPQSETITGAVGERVLQTESDIKYGEGTYGTRGVSQRALLEYWGTVNMLFGIGMHPFWVINKPETQDELIYQIGYADLRWAPFLVSYGLIGLVLAIIMQLSLLIFSFKILKREKKADIMTFIVLVTFATLFFDSFIYSSYVLITISVWGFWLYRSFYIASLVYKYELLNHKSEISQQRELFSADLPPPAARQLKHSRKK